MKNLSVRFPLFAVCALLCACSAQPAKEEAVTVNERCYVTGSNVPRKDCAAGATQALSVDPASFVQEMRRVAPETIK